MSTKKKESKTWDQIWLRNTIIEGTIIIGYCVIVLIFFLRFAIQQYRLINTLLG